MASDSKVTPPGGIAQMLGPVGGGVRCGADVLLFM